MRETHRNLWWINQPWWRGPGVWQSLYKILTVLQIFEILRSLMIACDGLKTRLTARIITDLRTLMPNSVIQIVTADCIASTEYCSSHPEFCSEFIRKHFAGNLSSLHEARKCSQICLKIKIWQLRMSLQTWLQGSLLSITADGSHIACAAPSVSCDPQLMWPMTRTIIPKQEYGPRPGAAWELAFHFYPLSVNSEEECRDTPSSNRSTWCG